MLKWETELEQQRIKKEKELEDYTKKLETRTDRIKKLLNL
jgi:hypothetical protein